MGRVAIVTDSAAELPTSLVEELGITVVPWHLGKGPSTLEDGPELWTPSFFQDARRKRALPSAVPPRSSQFAGVYAKLARDAEEIVSIHASSEMGQAVRAAQRARASLLGRCDVHVVDSMFVSKALGLLVIRASQAARDGADGAAIVRLVNGLIPRTYLAFHVDSLDYLERNGLYSNSRDAESGLPRSLLMMEAGQIVPLRRSRKRGTPVERLVEFISEFDDLEELVILHSGLSGGLNEMRACLGECLPERLFEEHCYGPVLATRIGPNALGVVAFEGSV